MSVPIPPLNFNLANPATSGLRSNDASASDGFTGSFVVGPGNAATGDGPDAPYQSSPIRSGFDVNQLMLPAAILIVGIILARRI